MNWNNIVKFNFSWACDGGAWLEDGGGNREWVPFKFIIEKFGQLWLDRQRRKQGWMTGCWVNVE